MTALAPGAGEAVLAVRGLRAEFVGQGGVAVAVRDVSFTVARGEKIAIVGESGCGKSTLALALLGLIEAPGRIAGGEVWLNGRPIQHLSDRAMRRVRGREIALIFQDPMGAMDPVKTIGHQIIDTIRRHQPGLGRRGARRRAIELLSEVEVPAADSRFDDYPHHYSGGMLQRVMIAIALANGPDIVIADEPTTALDVTTQAQVLDLLDRLVADRGAAIVLITHNLGIVAEFCDTVHIMYAGSFVERASVDDAFGRPLHPYTEALLASIRRPDTLAEGPLPSIPGFPPDLAALPPGCAFEPRCFYGHGRTRCHEQVPQLERLDEDTPGAWPVSAACHFAQERSATHRVALR